MSLAEAVPRIHEKIRVAVADRGVADVRNL